MGQWFWGCFSIVMLIFIRLLSWDTKCSISVHPSAAGVRVVSTPTVATVGYPWWADCVSTWVGHWLAHILHFT